MEPLRLRGGARAPADLRDGARCGCARREELRRVHRRREAHDSPLADRREATGDALETHRRDRAPRREERTGRAVNELELLDWKRRDLRSVRRGAGRRRTRSGAGEHWRAPATRCSARHPQSPLDDAGRARLRGRPLLPVRPGAARPRRRRARRGGGATSPAAPARRCASAASAGRASSSAAQPGARALLARGIRRRRLPAVRATRRAAARPTVAAGTCSTRSRAPISAKRRGRLVLDFNFAYNPSCAYDPSWACPLAPPANRLADSGAGRRAHATDLAVCRRFSAQTAKLLLRLLHGRQRVVL